jgi:hypothetical protein
MSVLMSVSIFQCEEGQITFMPDKDTKLVVIFVETPKGERLSHFLSLDEWLKITEFISNSFEKRNGE